MMTTESNIELQRAQVERRVKQRTDMSKKHEAAIERQQYTPKFLAGVCGNCAHMKCDMELPAWMQKQPGVWDDKYKQEKNHRCAIGGFPVKKQGSCAEHAFAGE